MGVHDDHRKRLRERFRKEGLKGFHEINVLELLLFYVIPRRDTNPIAHALLDRFGSMSQVLDAAPEELMKVEGVADATATYLNIIGDVCRYYYVNRTQTGVILNTIGKCGDYLHPRMLGLKNETVHLLCLDAKCKLLAHKELGEGTVNAAGVSVRKIVETALSTNASSVIMAHNHPSGLAIPSGEDVAVTRKVAMALSMVDIVLTDHLIMTDDDYVSLAESGYYVQGEI